MLAIKILPGVRHHLTIYYQNNKINTQKHFLSFSLCISAIIFTDDIDYGSFEVSGLLFRGKLLEIVLSFLSPSRVLVVSIAVQVDP